MDTILYLLADPAISTLIGWLFGKSNNRTELETKNVFIHQQYVELEKEFIGYRAAQTSQLSTLQQQLQTKTGELIAS